MSAADWTEELDFRLIFGEDRSQEPAADPDVRTPPTSTQALVNQPIGQELQSHYPSLPTTYDYQHLGYQVQGPQYGSLGNPRAQYGSLGNPRAFDCPSIQITSIAPNSHVELGSSQDAPGASGAEGGCPHGSWSRDHLYLPLDPCYRDRDPALSTSPCSSLSSRSWLSDLSSCESFSHVYDDEEGELNEAATRFTLGSPLTSPGCGGGAFGVEIWQQQYQHPLAFSQALSPQQSPRQSPCPSPRTSITEESWLNRRPASRSSSRPTSPCGKRRHSSADLPARSPSPRRSPSPTPGASPRDSVPDDTWAGSPAGILGSLLYSCQELDVPSKTRRTSGSQLGLLPGQGDSTLEELRAVVPFLDSPGEEGGQQEGLSELFLPVPSHYSWNKPKPGNPPLFRPSSPPPLDWPLPNQYDQLELKVEVQPRSHHRAHYETEGSRGSVKAASGGHPVVKLNGYSEQPLSLLVFIGTADDRYLRPHCFYQVHRVTGKTVTTACQERLLGNTKVLEIPLLPENGMSTSIDCAGILKLRNADIELRKAETDIGRKNTRVRVVFRVNIPQPGGRMLCLQAESVPVECSQRSAQEVPQVESFSPASCCVDGGEEMIITGSNISTQSKVVFMEKGPEGRSQWEVDVKVVPEKSSGSSVVVEIPPYYNKKTTCPVLVHFYVSNGRRRRSLTQSFTYLPGTRHHFLPPAGAPLVKQERWESDYIPHNPLGLGPASGQGPSPRRALCPDVAFYNSRGLPVHCGPPSQNLPPLLHHQLPSPGRHPSLPESNPRPEQHRPSFQLDTQNNTSSIPHQTSSIPLQTSSIPLQTSSVPHQYSTIPPQTSSVPPQTSSIPHQYSTIPPQTSSTLPPQIPSMPPQISSGGLQREEAPSLGSRRSVLTSVDPQKVSVLSSAGGVVSIKQEPEENPGRGSLGLQEITLDDVNEIIDRDICGLRGDAHLAQHNQHNQHGQYQYDWEQNSSDDVPFCGGLK
ncbi:nuclear factor of activated T-cells, cytoplasmic 3-like [Diretmus argenteus]